jgi:hypothetical protein
MPPRTAQDFLQHPLPFDIRLQPQEHQQIESAGRCLTIIAPTNSRRLIVYPEAQDKASYRLKSAPGKAPPLSALDQKRTHAAQQNS